MQTTCTPQRLRLSSPRCELGTPLCGAVSDRVRMPCAFCSASWVLHTHPRAPSLGWLLLLCFDAGLIMPLFTDDVSRAGNTPQCPPEFCLELFLTCISVERRPWVAFVLEVRCTCVFETFCHAKGKKKKRILGFVVEFSLEPHSRQPSFPCSAVDLGHEHFTLIFLQAGQTPT